MNEKIMRMVFPEKMQLRDAGKCPICKEVIDFCDFRDELSMREFDISGMCQTCQDDIFGI